MLGIRTKIVTYHLACNQLNPELLQELVTFKMPFGKYKGWLISSLPESYLVWFQSTGFPPGKLGALLGTMYEIKLNGLEYLLQPLKQARRF